MTFKIVVCIKQVPDTTDIKWTERNTIAREGMDLIINPYDLGAIQMSLDVKKYIGDVKIALVSMGPGQAVESLSYGLALGADEAYLLCDRKFAASDTLATAYCLKCFIDKYFKDVNLIICGQQAIDGDTAQTPAALAEKLGIPSVTLTSKLNWINVDSAVLERNLPYKTEEVEVKLPALIAVDSTEIFKQPKIEDFIRAQDLKIQVLKACDIDSQECNIGINGSPTQVKKAFRPLKHRDSKVIDNMTNEAFMDLLLSEIQFKAQDGAKE